MVMVIAVGWDVMAALLQGMGYFVYYWTGDWAAAGPHGYGHYRLWQPGNEIRIFVPQWDVMQISQWPQYCLLYWNITIGRLTEVELLM